MLDLIFLGAFFEKQNAGDPNRDDTRCQIPVQSELSHPMPLPVPGEKPISSSSCAKCSEAILDQLMPDTALSPSALSLGLFALRRYWPGGQQR